jgi:cell division protein FtsX
MIKRVLNFSRETEEIFYKKKNYYNMNLVSLALMIFVLNFFLAYSFNIVKLNEKIKNNYKINVYIEKGTSDVGIEELEKKILAYDDVRYVKFRSKEMVLNEMEKELGMSIRKGENPLYDSMLITFRNPENLKSLEEKLLKENNIIEVMYSEQSIEGAVNRIEENRKLIMYVGIFAILPILVTVYNLIHGALVSQLEDIKSRVYLGMKKSQALKPYYFINISKVFVSSLLGGLLFLNLYEAVKNKNLPINLESVLLSNLEAVAVTGILVAFMTIILPYLSVKSINISGE